MAMFDSNCPRPRNRKTEIDRALFDSVVEDEYEDENAYEDEPEDELNRLDWLVATRS
jgi:hypothetical protein